MFTGLDGLPWYLPIIYRVCVGEHDAGYIKTHRIRRNLQSLNYHTIFPFCKSCLAFISQLVCALTILGDSGPPDVLLAKAVPNKPNALSNAATVPFPELTSVKFPFPASPSLL